MKLYLDQTPASADSNKKLPGFEVASFSKIVNGVSVPDSIDGRYFRRRFRIPYKMFQALIQVMLDDNWFPGDFEADGGGKCCKLGRKGASLHVKVLSVLRVLGRGVCFDELYDGSGLSESITSTFFHRFVAMFVERYGIFFV